MAASLVLICHSAKLAQGLLEVVEQVAQGRVRAFATGGLDENTLGANPDQIAAVLEEAYSPEGTLVLMDLGSSILAAETVLSEWPPGRREHVVLSGAPLVEGAVIASAQLAAGAPLHEAASAARNALTSKAVHLGLPPATDPTESQPFKADREIRLMLTHPMGLHARPAALFVESAQKFDSEIRIRHAGREANAKSILEVLGLGANQGAEVTLAAQGPDAVAAIAALRSLLAGDGRED